MILTQKFISPKLRNCASDPSTAPELNASMTVGMLKMMNLLIEMCMDDDCFRRIAIVSFPTAKINLNKSFLFKLLLYFYASFLDQNHITERKFVNQLDRFFNHSDLDDGLTNTG